MKPTYPPASVSATPTIQPPMTAPLGQSNPPSVAAANE